MKPNPSRYALVEADAPSDAAQEFHMMVQSGVRLHDGSCSIFSIIEVDGKEFLSRIFRYGIGRIGGMRYKGRFDAYSIIEAANMLDVPLDMLYDDDWIAEKNEDVPLLDIPAIKWYK